MQETATDDANGREGGAPVTDGSLNAATGPDGLAGERDPMVRAVTAADVRDAFAAGMADWRECPLYGLAFGAVYAGLGVVIQTLHHAGDLTTLIVPALSAFLLIGPGIALGLYEISRRLEADEPIRPGPIVTAGLRHGGGQVALFGAVLVAIALVWMGAAELISIALAGDRGGSVAGLLSWVATTGDGLRYALVGTIVGAVFAGTTFLIGVVGGPMLLDRDLSAVQACRTSARAVGRSPGAFLLYGLLVTIIIAAGMAAFLVGLLVALPVIGFTTWHLYRRAVG